MISTLRWLGSDEMHLDAPHTTLCQDMVVGCYGGRTSAGANKNEDAALVWCPGNAGAPRAWEFAVLLDAHYSIQSAELVLSAVEAEQEALVALLSQPIRKGLQFKAFDLLHEHLYSLFRSAEFRAQCRRVEGEASCLICARKGPFLWWLSVGDCVVYVLHPELARLGQFALNRRSYYEWIGQRNTFDLPTPCYSSGVRLLGEGVNIVVMTTDGLLECGRRPFEDSTYLYQMLTRPGRSLEANVRSALEQVHKEKGRDSATVIAWSH